jgi:hypothetical protein
MSKYNEDISLWMTDGNGFTRTFYAFKSEKDPVIGLINRIILPNKYIMPIARIYDRTEIKHCFVQGVKVANIECQERWYGKEISSFKIKLILKDNSFVGPFYSNSTIIDLEQQFNALVEQYCNYVYHHKYSSAIVFKLGTEEILIAKIQFKNNKLIINKLTDL